MNAATSRCGVFCWDPSAPTEGATVTDSNQDLMIRPYTTADEPAVLDLWRRCGLLHPSNDPRREIASKVAHSPDLFLVGTLGGAVVATVMVGFEGRRGWINDLGVDPRLR